MRPTELGVGIVFWPELAPLCQPQEGLVNVIEIEPEAYWRPVADGFVSDLHDALAELPQPRLMHGVGAPLGGVCPPPPGHLTAFAADLAELRPAWVSEHLSFSRFAAEDGMRNAFFLLPPAQSRAGIQLAARAIRERRSALSGKPLAFETGVSYLPPLPDEVPDGEFAAAVAEAADCGILLDLHNLWCNERNGRQPLAAFVDALPLERVWELHLAGGEDQGGFYLDAHSGPIDPALFAVAAELVPRLPNLGAIVFEIMPDFAIRIGLPAIARSLAKLHELWSMRRPIDSHGSPSMPRAGVPSESACDHLLAPEPWEGLLGAAVTGDPKALIDCWPKAEPAIALYRRLAREARASALAAAAPETLHRLLAEHGPARTRELLACFWNIPPGYTAVEEAAHFLKFLTSRW